MKGIFHLSTLVPRFHRWNGSIEVVDEVVDPPESNAIFSIWIGLTVLEPWRIQSPEYMFFTKTSLDRTTNDILSSSTDIFLCLIETHQNMCPHREDSTDFSRWTRWGRCCHCASNDRLILRVWRDGLIDFIVEIDWLQLTTRQSTILHLGHASRRHIPFTHWNNSSLEKNEKKYNRDSPDHGQVFSLPRYTSNISWKHRTRYRCPHRESPYRSLNRSRTWIAASYLLCKVHVILHSGFSGIIVWARVNDDAWWVSFNHSGDVFRLSSDHWALDQQRLKREALSIENIQCVVRSMKKARTQRTAFAKDTWDRWISYDVSASI